MKDKLKANKFFDDFFYKTSKVILFLPLIILIFGLFIKFNQTNQKEKKNLKYEFLSPTLKEKRLPTVSDAKVNFNLNGPFFCFFSQKDASISAFIKDKKIKLMIEQKKEKQYLLVKDDCLYQWQENQFTGNKTCGINQYLEIADYFLKTNQKLFFDFLLKQNQFNFVKEADFSLENICKKKKVNDDNFLIPINILFKNLN